MSGGWTRPEEQLSPQKTSSLHHFLVLNAIFISLHLPTTTYGEEIHIWTQPLLKTGKQKISVCIFGLVVEE